MNQITQKAKIVFLASSILLSSTIGLADNAEDRYVYVGTELGLSEPIVKSFDHKAEAGTTTMRLKQSRMFGGRVGYAFYPGMMIELSGTHQPKYRLAYRLPSVSFSLFPGGPNVTIPRTNGETKVSANVFTLNLIYEMQKQFLGVKPYVIFGAGVAQVSIRPTSSTTDVFASAGKSDKEVFFKVKKNKINCYVWQFGGGFTKDLGDNLSIDLGAKLQVVNDIKIKYDTFDVKIQNFSAAKPIKKTIGVGEFTLGFTFKLPV
ncbi:MAG: outer membrane beta-barrel protein [Rickettsiaceae bacterium]|nr:outer membrane beta-barrel protein [Rickettsiaceae bacterium]MDP4832381.1 outer membrane beta-barrel protein [Rickettsiaceae bacterium]MDP5021347.1 outer membrane beta-barrel protein [Rickettsiaceae bacterium]MDP5082875.1 outer membrane beta-barrel protein [Rickettsiaceae bacterium]